MRRGQRKGSERRGSLRRDSNHMSNVSADVSNPAVLKTPYRLSPPSHLPHFPRPPSPAAFRSVSSGMGARWDCAGLHPLRDHRHEVVFSC